MTPKKPTMRLAWKSVFRSEPKDPVINVTYCDDAPYYPSECYHAWMLHQWWQDEEGHGEWRPIELIETT